MKMSFFSVVACILVYAPVSLWAAGRAVIADGSGKCPAAVSAWISLSQTEGLISQIERLGTDEGGNFTQADLPNLNNQAAASMAAALAAEKSCGVGDQRGEALHVMLCGEGNADIQLDPNGNLGGSMEACPAN